MTSLYENPIYKVKNSALPLAILWLIAYAILGGAEFQLWLPTWLVLVAAAPFALLAAMHLHHAYLRLSWAARTYRSHLPSLVRRMVGIFPKLARCQTESVKIAMHLALAIVGLALSLIFRIYSPALIGAFFAGIALTALLRALLPPGGVYLASSNPDRIRLFSQLSLRSIPAFAALLEVSNLVDPNRSSNEFLKGAIGVVNDYRTSNSSDWTYVVRQLIEMSAVVVVDGRDETPGVRFEVERIIRNRLDFKATFLSVDGSLPPILKTLNAKPTHPTGKFQVMTPEMALQVVPLIIREAHSYWIPVHMDT